MRGIEKEDSQCSFEYLAQHPLEDPKFGQGQVLLFDNTPLIWFLQEGRESQQCGLNDRGVEEPRREQAEDCDYLPSGCRVCLQLTFQPYIRSRLNSKFSN